MKKILLLWPKFFSYEELIVSEYKKLGYEIRHYDERPVTSVYSKAILRVFPGLVTKTSDKYYKKIINENRDIEYDYIVIGDCDAISEESLRMLKTHFIKTQMILYLGDSVNNIKGVIKKISYFDVVYSFDKMDCQNYNFEFLPFFFADEYKRASNTNKLKFKYDFSFIGTIHSNRLETLNKIENIANENGLTCYFYKYLQSWFMYYYYYVHQKSFRYSRPSDYKYKKLTADQIIKIYNESLCIIDIQHSNQTGLTMRTFEMMGLKKKLITTNDTVKDYDFYNPNNICIIDPVNIHIPKDFFEKPYEEIPEEIYDDYSLESWVLKLLSKK